MPLWLLSRPVCGVCGWHAHPITSSTHTQPQPLWLCPSPHHHSLVCVCMETRATWPCNAPQCLCVQHLTPQSTQPSLLSMCADVCCQTVLVHHLHTIIAPFHRATLCFIHTPHAHNPCVSAVLSSTLAFTSVGLLGNSHTQSIFLSQLSISLAVHCFVFVLLIIKTSFKDDCWMMECTHETIWVFLLSQTESNIH